ncbi:MAG: MalY/PatB family protein [Niameybacter sp.]
MRYHFDHPIDRTHTNCYKVDCKAYYHIPENTLSFWVADMDFATAPCITDALIERAKHPIYGYTYKPDAYNEALVGWFQRRHQWHIEKEWIVTAPSIVCALGLIAQTFCHTDDFVLVQRPVYHSFESSAMAYGRQVLNNPLILKNDHYEIDFEDLEEKLSRPHTKLFFLCNPHNPVGRVWTYEELKRMGELCVKHQVLIVSDEIHQDFVFKDYHYTPMGNISSAISNQLITCVAPGKTFNVASISSANIMISNATIRKPFEAALAPLFLHNLSPFAIDLVVAGYNEGDAWVDALVSYIEANKNYVETFLKTHLPILRLIQSEGTYLLWIDCRNLGFETQEALIDFITHKGKCWVHSGTTFDPTAIGFIRMNIGTPRCNLEKALLQFQKAIATLPL